jgi:cytochrome c oxidase subunit I+III
VSAASGGEGAGARALHEGLTRILGNAPGWRGLSAVNHTTVGMRFIVTGFVFFLIGGLLAMLMRSQLAWSENDVLDFQAYNEAFTMHGTTMMFLFAVPIMEGFAVYLIPKMIGARDLPLPRLGAYGYWCYLFGGVLLYSSFLFDAVPDAGWFMYVPLTNRTFSPGLDVDFWLLGITFAEISAVSAAVELIVSILKTRAPGMSIDCMPFFAWGVLAAAFAIVFAFPPLIVATSAGRPLASYTLGVLAIVAITILSFGLWAHHMFTVGISFLTLSFFSAASMAVAIPSGILIFSWIATLWNGRTRLETPLLYILGLVFIFVLGGLTGVMVALVPFDWQVHDTHFVVAHMHYVLIGGVVFPVFAAFY